MYKVIIRLSRKYFLNRVQIKFSLLRHLIKKTGQKRYMKNSSIIMNHVSKSKLFKDNNSSNIDMNKLR